MTKKRGDLVVVDGLDGIGKGVIERVFKEFEERAGKAVFDTISFSRASGRLPILEEFFDPPRLTYHVLMLAEPTYCGGGRDIREELTANNGRDYSANILIEAYAANGLIQMQRTSDPARENGIDCIQSRCRAATFAFQIRQAEMEGKDPKEIRERILQHEGTQHQLRSGIDLLVIPTIEEVARLQERLSARLKDDNNRWEKLAFQASVKPYFESEDLRKIFESYGTKVAYLDAGKSEQHTRDQALDIYRTFKETREVPEEFQRPNFN